MFLLVLRIDQDVVEIHNINRVNKVAKGLIDVGLEGC
jgi:hypothetical protein